MKNERLVMKKLKNFIKERFNGKIQMFDSHNTVGDPMETIFREDGVAVDYCYHWGYIEIFGLTDIEFSELNREFGTDYSSIDNFISEIQDHIEKNEQKEKDVAIIYEKDVIAIYEQGYARGYEDAIKENRDRSHVSYNEGYKSGVKIGKVSGYGNGFQDGVDVGTYNMCKDLTYILENSKEEDIIKKIRDLIERNTK